MQEITKEFVKDVALIEKESFSTEAWSENNILSAIDNKNCVFRILVIDGILVGYYSYYIILDEAYINNIAVKSDYRNQGFGKVLIEDLIETAKKRGINNITLEVRSSNIVARKLYEDFGFINEGIRPKFYDNTEDAVIYWKRY